MPSTTTPPRARWRLTPDRALPLDGPVLMGVCNVTPDSFSDGGLHASPEDAVATALRLVEEGAAIIDVGGESTRPGAERVAGTLQQERVLPVIEGIRALSDVPISIDTTRCSVAAAALDAGADLVNDVSAGEEDPGMLPLVAERGCGIVLMHRHVPPRDDEWSHRRETPVITGDVVEVVRAFLAKRITAAVASGINPEAIVIDPGLGFGKTVAQNYELVHRTGVLKALGRPVLSGASRKSFLGAVTGQPEPADRTAGSVALSVAHRLAGADIFRVHDVAMHRAALAVVEAVRSATMLHPE